MKLDHLTFGQLYKLSSSETLMRVTRTYHSALRRVWDADPEFIGRPFFVSEAEKPGNFSSFARPWRELIAWLRGPDTRAQLRKLANESTVRTIPGMWTEFRRFPLFNWDWRNDYIRALVVVKFCNINGVSATIRPKFDEDSGRLALSIRVETDTLQCGVLTWKSGLDWKYIQDLCLLESGHPRAIFWWVPKDFTGLVNPANRPVNTPDVLETANELLTPYEKTNRN